MKFYPFILCALKNYKQKPQLATEDKITKLFRMADDFYSFFNIL